MTSETGKPLDQCKLKHVQTRSFVVVGVVSRNVSRLKLLRRMYSSLAREAIAFCTVPFVTLNSSAVIRIPRIEAHLQQELLKFLPNNTQLIKIFEASPDI